MFLLFDEIPKPGHSLLWLEGTFQPIASGFCSRVKAQKDVDMAASTDTGVESPWEQGEQPGAQRLLGKKQVCFRTFLAPGTLLLELCCSLLVHSSCRKAKLRGGARG